MRLVKKSKWKGILPLPKKHLPFNSQEVKKSVLLLKMILFQKIIYLILRVPRSQSKYLSNIVVSSCGNPKPSGGSQMVTFFPQIARISTLFLLNTRERGSGSRSLMFYKISVEIRSFWSPFGSRLRWIVRLAWRTTSKICFVLWSKRTFF